jgi:hypothetical protein
MATNCDACGHRSNEVKAGCGIEQKGRRIEVKVRSREDFSRDVLKVRAFILNCHFCQSLMLSIIHRTFHSYFLFCAVYASNGPFHI